MRPTIKKIAELAGVTHATVSMVLNNKPGPSEAMKEKILKIYSEKFENGIKKLSEEERKQILEKFVK